MKAKDDKLLTLFFENPKHWRFEELREQAKISKPQLARWLKLFEKEGLIKRFKKRGMMPFYVQDFENSRFHNAKKFFAYKNLSNQDYLII